MNKSIIILAVCILLAKISIAQEFQDIEGSNDHTMISRMKNYIIGEYEVKYDQVEIPLSNEKLKVVEGNKTYLYYYFDESKSSKFPSVYQIVKNHENAINKIGGKLLYNDGDGTVTFNILNKSTEVWVMLRVANSGAVYYLTIIEIANMNQDVSANEIYTSLNKDGFIALKINFETNQSAITKSSLPIVDEIYSMLVDNPEIRISVEGHTDNIGEVNSNLRLSTNRAKAVVEALVSKGIPADRLMYKGWGSQKPIAPNNTEEGRSANRRVEIKKI